VKYGKYHWFYHLRSSFDSSYRQHFSVWPGTPS
jgi:hypothetical protein